MDFLTQLFTDMNTDDSIKVLFFLLVSFLIGWLFSHWSKAGKIRRLKKAVKDKDDELVTLRAKYNTLVEDYELKDADLKKAHLAQEDFQSRIARLERDKTQLGEEVHFFKNQSDQFQTEKDNYESQIESLNTQIIGLKTQLSTNPQSDPSSHSTGISHSSDLTTLENNYKQNSTRLELLEARLNRLANENEDLKKTVNSLKTNTLSTGSTDITNIAEPTGNTTEATMLAKSTIKKFLGNRIVKANATDKDDLKLINGIGPFIEDKLNQIGIYTYEQIEQFDDEIIELITEAIQFFPGRIKRDDWVGQASELFNGQTDKFLER